MKVLRGVARGGPGGPGGPEPRPPGIWQISKPYSNRGGGQIMPLTLYCQPPRIQKVIYTPVEGIHNGAKDKKKHLVKWISERYDHARTS